MKQNFVWLVHFGFVPMAGFEGFSRNLSKWVSKRVAEAEVEGARPEREITKQLHELENYHIHNTERPSWEVDAQEGAANVLIG